MAIELCNLKDEPEVVQLQTRLWRNSETVSCYFQLSHITLEQHQNWLSSLHNEPPETIAFLIKYDGLAVGVTYFHSVERDLALGDWGIYIYDESIRGKGIGRQALRLCLQYAKEQLHLNTVFLEVKESNQRAITLYESQGFVFETHKNDDIRRYVKYL